MNSAIKLIPALMFFLLSCSTRSRIEVNDSTPSSTPIEVSTEDGLRIAYNVYGKGDTTLIFVHGWGIDQNYWAPQVEEFKTDYQVVTLDLPGFGASDKHRQRWEMETYGRDIDTFIDQLGLENVILVGHSMGGDVVLEAALLNKEVIALIGVDNFKDVGEGLDEASQAEIAGFLEALKQNYKQVAAAMAEESLFHPSTPDEVRARVVADIRSADSLIAYGTLESLAEYARFQPFQLAKLKQKLYLINSNATPTHVAGMDYTGVDYEILPIDSTGHYPMIEKPRDFNRLLHAVLHSD